MTADQRQALAAIAAQIADLCNQAAAILTADEPAQSRILASELVVGDRWRRHDRDPWREVAEVRPAFDPLLIVVLDERDRDDYLDEDDEVQVIRPRHVAERLAAAIAASELIVSDVP